MDICTFSLFQLRFTGAHFTIYNIFKKPGKNLQKNEFLKIRKKIDASFSHLTGTLTLEHAFLPLVDLVQILKFGIMVFETFFGIFGCTV